MAILASLTGGATPTGAAAPPTACTKTWASPGTPGLWDDPTDPDDATEAQWSPPGVPGAGDTACLPAGDYEVTIARPAVAAAVVVGDDGAPASPQPRLVVDATRLDLGAGGSSVAGTLELDSTAPGGPGGVLTQAPGGELAVDGVLRLLPGTGGTRSLRISSLDVTGHLDVWGISRVSATTPGPARVAVPGQLDVVGTNGDLTIVGTDAVDLVLDLRGSDVHVERDLTGAGPRATLLLGDGSTIDGTRLRWSGGLVQFDGPATGEVRSRHLSTTVAGEVPAGITLRAADAGLASGWRVASGTTVVNHGLIAFGGPGASLTRVLTVEPGAGLVNEGVLRWHAEGAANRAATGGGSLTNHGQIVVDGATRWWMAGGFTSTGAITVADGVDVDATGTQHVTLGGAVTLGDGVRLRAGGDQSLTLADGVVVDGPGRLEHQGGSLDFAGAATATVWVSANVVELDSDVPVDARVVVGSSQALVNPSLAVTAPRTVHGTLELRSAPGATGWVGIDAGVTLAVNRFVVDAASTGGNTIGGDGTLEVTGSATIATELQRRDGPTVVHGALTVDDDAVFSAGPLRLDGHTTVDGELSSAGLTLAGGELTGHGTIAADVAHDAGTLRPTGDPGSELTIIGAYSGGAPAAVAVPMGGPSLRVHGAATLGGTLHVTGNSSDVPAVARTLVSATVLTGAPATVSGVPSSWIVTDLAGGRVRLRAIPRFTDVGVGNPFLLAIERLADAGVLSGFADGAFRPSLAASRGAAVATLWRRAGEPPASAPPFTDVAEDHPFHDAITWAQATGLVAGFTDGTFRPASPVTRGALVQILWRQSGSPPTPVAPNGPFPDVPADHPFATAITWASSTGLVVGDVTDEFRPGAAVTRQVLAEVLDRQGS